MKLTTAVSQQITSTVALGVASMRAMLCAEPPKVAQAVASRATGLDARLDAIRRAGL